MEWVSLSKPQLNNLSLTPPLSKPSISVTRCAVTLVFVLEVGCFCLESPHLVPEITSPEKCCAKAELPTLKLQEEQIIFDQCKSFEGFAQLK